MMMMCTVIIVVNQLLPRGSRINNPSRKPYKKKHSDTNPLDLIRILKERLSLAKKDLRVYSKLTMKLWLYLLESDTIPSQTKTNFLSNLTQKESEVLLDIIEAQEDKKIDISFYSKRLIEKEIKI